MRISSTHRRRSVIALAATLLCASAGTGYAAASGEDGSVDRSVSAQTDGTLSISPPTGKSNGTAATQFTASAPCSASATNFIVTISGSGITEQNATTNAAITDESANLSETPGGPVVVGLGKTWDDLATGLQAPATLPLKGPITVKLKCVDTFDTQTFDTFTGTVTFTPSTGTLSDFAVSGASAPTPSPTPKGTPTPTPAPTPAPTGSATPTPVPSGTPAADPGSNNDATDGTSGGGSGRTTGGRTTGGTGGSGTATATGSSNLPGTGGSNPMPQILFALMLGCAGLSLLLFESASRPDEDRAGEDGQ